MRRRYPASTESSARSNRASTPSRLHARRTSSRRSRCRRRKYDGVVFESEHNGWDIRTLRDCLQYLLNRAQIAQVGLGRAGGDADGAHSAERQREEPVARQAGARPRLLRHRLAARQHGGGGLQRGRRLPLSAPEEQAALRAGRHPRRRADARRRATGASTQQEYYERADVWPLAPQGEILVILHDRGHRRASPTSTTC